MKHLFLASPTYDSSVSTGYLQSMQMTLMACTKAGIVLTGPDFKAGPYIEANRNWLVKRFLETSADAILFIDADVTWDENAVVRLYESGFDLCGGVYPFKQDREGYPIRLLGDRIEQGFHQALYLPGGFMMIRRKVFDILKDSVPYYADPNYNGEIVHAYFQNVIHNGHAFVGEDVEFCNRWHKAGGTVWLYPDIDFEHTGFKSWTGNYARHQA